MSREKFTQRVAEHLDDFFSDAITNAMRPVIAAQDQALDVARKFAGPTSGDALNVLEEALAAARDRFEIDSKEIRREVSGAIEDELESAGLLEEEEVERRIRESAEAPSAFLELLGISEHDQALAGDGLGPDDKLRRWSQLPAFRATILRLATQICDEDDLAARRGPYVFRPEAFDASPAPQASGPGWHAQAVEQTRKAKKERGAK